MANFLDISQNMQILKDAATSTENRRIEILNRAALKNKSEEEDKGKKLEEEKKVLDLADRYIKGVTSVDDYKTMKAHVEKTYGIDYLPNVSSEEELMKVKDYVSGNIKNYRDYRDGKEYTLYKTNKETGETEEIKVNQQTGEEYEKKGWSKAKTITPAISDVKARKKAEAEAAAEVKAQYPTESTPKTAMEAFLKKNPNATIDEIAEYSQKLKASDGKNSGKGEYAPDMQTYVHTKSGKTKSVNVRDPRAISDAVGAGFQAAGPLQRGFLQEEGKSGAEYASEIVKDAQKAQGNITTLSTMDQLLDRFQSGKLTNVTKNIQEWANAFGLPIDTANLSSKEAFNALGEQLALQSRNMGEGMVLAGQMSDKDVQFLRDMNPQLLISKGGNKLIIKVRKAIAKRNIESAKVAKEYKDNNNGVLDQLGFRDYIAKTLGTKSVFGIPEGATVAGTDRITGLPVYKSGDKLIIPDF